MNEESLKRFVTKKTHRRKVVAVLVKKRGRLVIRNCWFWTNPDYEFGPPIIEGNHFYGKARQ